MLRVGNAGVLRGGSSKLVSAFVALIWITIIGQSDAAAGWRIDGARYLQSVHGETACIDCHSDIEEAAQHPEPANVTKKMEDFFDPEDKCLTCHDDVQSQIDDDGEHGGEEVDDAERFMNCIECHDPHYEGAPDEVAAADAAEMSEDNASCMDCHQTVRPDDPNAIQKNREFCYACHSTGKGMPASVPVMDPEQMAQSPHAELDCLTCHPQSVQYEHHKQSVSDCGQCHQPHEESVTHEAHAGVSCQACHLGDVIPVRDGNAVLWERAALPGTVSSLHNLTKPDGEGCARCHFDGNDVGAAAMILPPKSVLCMPCHTATFTAGDTTTLVSLAVFAFGMIGFMTLWFSSSFAGSAGGGFIPNAAGAIRGAVSTLFSAKIGTILSTLWYDVFLQRRLYERSPKRWAIHALIFWPFVIRFFWGLIALITTNYMKGLPLVWALINKNHPVTAFVFDLTGLLLVVGIVMAFIRGSEEDKTRTAGLPSQDRLALTLIGAIAVIGFVLEGMRIALTGAEGPAAFAFIGYALSKLFITMDGLSEVYGYCWYIHAILTGAFVAYLPFSRMMHIIMSPVVMAMNAVTKEDHH